MFWSTDNELGSATQIPQSAKYVILPLQRQLQPEEDIRAGGISVTVPSRIKPKKNHFNFPVCFIESQVPKALNGKIRVVI